MKVLLDHNMPMKIRTWFPGHLVLTTRAMGWAPLRNGDLIRVADNHDFQVLLTADKKMYREQSHLDRRIALVVLSRPELQPIQANLEAIRAAVGRAQVGSYEFVTFAPRPAAER